MKAGSLKVYIIIAIALVIFLPPFARYQELRYKNARIQARIAALERENKDLEKQKYRLETDISYVEDKAREKIGVVRKGEIVLKEAPADRR